MIRSFELNPALPKIDPTTREKLPNLLRNSLILMLFIIYSGLFQFLVYVSPLLLHGFYAVMLGINTLYVYLDRQAIHRLRSVLPYLVWIIIYCLWGTLVSIDKDAVLIEVIVVFIRNVLIVTAIAFSLKDLQHLAKFATLMQVAVIINFAIMTWQTVNPIQAYQVIGAIDPAGNLTFMESRPAGLWRNPNAGAIALIFGLLTSRWSHRPLAWLGRIAAIGGIYFSASSNGFLLLFLNGLSYFLFAIKSMRFTLRRLSFLFNGLALIACLSLYLSFTAVPLNIDIENDQSLARVFNDSGRNSKYSHRAELTSVAARRAQDGPLYGYGIFTFTIMPNDEYYILRGGAHNIYLAVWGEIGFLGLSIYLITLMLGIRHLLNTKLFAYDRFIIVLMWISYLITGFVWHNQITSTVGIVLIGLTYHIPQLVQVNIESDYVRKKQDE